MIDYEYKSISKSNVVIALLFLIVLFIGYMYLSHTQALEENYQPLANEFNKKDIREKCLSQEHKFLIDCFKAPFYKALRTGNSYEGISLYYLKNKLYKRDLVLNSDTQDQMIIKINNLEMTYTFLKLEESRTIDRRSLKIGSLLLTEWKKKQIISEIQKTSELVQEVDSALPESTISEVDKKRFEMVRERLNKILDQLTT